MESSSKLDFIERSLLSQNGRADRRGIGVTFKGDLKLSKVKVMPSLGIFNGNGQNRFDSNDTKDVVGRIAPKTSDAIHLGVAHYNGTDKIYTGGEIKFIAEPFVVCSECAAGKSDNTNQLTYYASAGYKIFRKNAASVGGKIRLLRH